VASRACLHRKNGFTVNWVKGSSLNVDVTGRQPIRRFYWVMEQLWTTHWSRVIRPHSVVVSDKLKSVGLITAFRGVARCCLLRFQGQLQHLKYQNWILKKKWTCYIVEWSDCRRTRPFEQSKRFCCQRLHRSERSTGDAKVFLVVRRGWQVRINWRSVTEEVPEWEVYGDISSEEATSQHTVRSQRSHHSSALHAYS